jgi:hypothetical protein
MANAASANMRDGVTRAETPSNARDVAMHADPRGSGGPEPDEIYGVVSVLYHALQGATACDKYIGDAQKAGDEELERFFRACRTEAHARSRRAQVLLAQRLGDDEEEARR